MTRLKTINMKYLPKEKTFLDRSKEAMGIILGKTLTWENFLLELAKEYEKDKEKKNGNR